MSDLQAAGTIFLFFALRCIVPLLITLGIGYLMNRLVGRWEAEEAAALAEQSTHALKDNQVVIPAAAVSERKERIPCWILRNCDEKQREGCPAYKEPSLPCWIARLLSEGSMPSSCPDCEIYDPGLVIS